MVDEQFMWTACTAELKRCASLLKRVLISCEIAEKAYVEKTTSGAQEDIVLVIRAMFKIKLKVSFHKLISSLHRKLSQNLSMDLRF